MDSAPLKGIQETLAFGPMCVRDDAGLALQARIYEMIGHSTEGPLYNLQLEVGDPSNGEPAFVLCVALLRNDATVFRSMPVARAEIADAMTLLLEIFCDPLGRSTPERFAPKPRMVGTLQRLAVLSFRGVTGIHVWARAPGNPFDGYQIVDVGNANLVDATRAMLDLYL